MRDHNYQSRMKNCHVRFILTVDNEKSLREKKITIRDYRLVFLSRRDITSQRSGQYKIWTAGYGLRTTDYGLGIKHGLGIKRGLSITNWV